MGCLKHVDDLIFGLFETLSLFSVPKCIIFFYSVEYVGLKNVDKFFSILLFEIQECKKASKYCTSKVQNSSSKLF